MGTGLGAWVDGAVGVRLGTELNLGLGMELAPTVGAWVDGAVGVRLGTELNLG